MALQSNKKILSTLQKACFWKQKLVKQVSKKIYLNYSYLKYSYLNYLPISPKTENSVYTNQNYAFQQQTFDLNSF